MIARQFQSKLGNKKFDLRLPLGWSCQKACSRTRFLRPIDFKIQYYTGIRLYFEDYVDIVPLGHPVEHPHLWKNRLSLLARGAS
jgi:hypothetical protein